MKKIKLYKILGLILVLSMFAVSCEEWIDPELNEDPDALTDVSMKSLLPNTQLSLFFVVGDADMTGYTGSWTQHLRGADRQFNAVYNYNVTPTDMNNLWSGMYEDNLEGLQLIKEKAAEQSSPHYAGVAKVLEAVSLGYLTDFFGDIPYSDAFKGEAGNYQPEYDSQEEIYNTINTLLTEAISDLEAEENQIPLEGDMIYGGDVEMWIKAAHSLRARYNMHLTEKGGVDFDNVISDLNNGISSNSEDLQLPFMEDLAHANPMHQFINERSGYIADNDFFQNFIEGDPRQSELYYGTADNTGFWYHPTSPVAVLENAEALFLKAEAQYRNDEPSLAKESLIDAIDASLAKLGVEDETWQDSVETAIDGYSGEALMEEIMEQKYIHMFGNPTIAYVDFRRTGYPVELSPVVGNEFPDRFPYPSDEIELNQNTPEWKSIYNNLWMNPTDHEKSE
ncbi:MAG: SusD/RagB family nutrient-binding outer membrane lipoprotein [Bacteroidales bacterium]